MPVKAYVWNRHVLCNIKTPQYHETDTVTSLSYRHLHSAPFLYLKLVFGRFFGNRSYCYYCLEKYPQALADAERSIQLAPDWPKGHFRQGSALMGMKVGKRCVVGIWHIITEISADLTWLVCFFSVLKRYSEAEKAMEQVLKLDKHCEEAVMDLLDCKVLQLMVHNRLQGCFLWSWLADDINNHTSSDYYCQKVLETHPHKLAELLIIGTWLWRRAKCHAAGEVFHCAGCSDSLLRCCQRYICDKSWSVFSICNSMFFFYYYECILCMLCWKSSFCFAAGGQDPLIVQPG